jgi:hypothetical protein
MAKKTKYKQYTKAPKKVAGKKFSIKFAKPKTIKSIKLKK